MPFFSFSDLVYSYLGKDLADFWVSPVNLQDQSLLNELAFINNSIRKSIKQHIGLQFLETATEFSEHSHEEHVQVATQLVLCSHWGYRKIFSHSSSKTCNSRRESLDFYASQSQIG